jgi:hypothetical protein
MKMERKEEHFHTFLTPSLDAYEWSASNPITLFFSTHQIGRSSLDRMVKRKFPTPTKYWQPTTEPKTNHHWWLMLILTERDHTDTSKMDVLHIWRPILQKSFVIYNLFICWAGTHLSAICVLGINKRLVLLEELFSYCFRVVLWQRICCEAYDL